MKAYVLNKIGDLSYQDVPKPELKKDWALIKVKAAGICSSDIPRIYERGTYHFPTIPGHEFAGDVVKVNGEKYTDIVGKRVSVFPLIPCGKCSQCKKKMYEMCENYDYIGSRRNGGFAEYVEVPVWNLIELGENIHIFQGIRENIKVTTPEDLESLRAIQYYEHYKQFAQEVLKYGL